MGSVVSVNVGMPQDVAWNGVTVHTGAWKDPVAGARVVHRLGMEGDGQGDLYGHGGPNRAVLVYQVESYDYWRRHFDRPDIGPGTFAENLTVAGLADSEVYIGDRYRIGGAEFEVSQPRVTCFRAGLRIGQPELAALLVAHHRPGFYLRVLEEGPVAAGDPIMRTAVGTGRVSVADVDALLYLPQPDVNTLRRAVHIPALSPGWQTSLRQLLDAAEHPESAAAGPATPAWAGFRPLTVTEVVTESPTILSFHLADPEGAALPGARPGQYLTVRVPDEGAGLVRSYSLSGTPDAPGYRISVKREPNGQASNRIHHAVRPGTQLQVAAPRGEFVLDPGTSPVVLVSAGVGITPVLAMLHQLAAEHSRREVWWLHAARRPEEQAFAAETEALLGQLDRARSITFYSGVEACPADGATHRDPAAERERLTEVGRLTAERLARLNPPTDAVAYICGPDAFMADMSTGLRKAGLDEANIRTETFGSLSAINPGVVPTGDHVPHQPPGPPGTGPTITFARSGITAAFDTSKQSLLEFAEACDIPTRWQCRTGVCRTCETGLLAGEVDYAPAPLDAPVPGTVLPCCARPRTDTVLDL